MAEVGGGDPETGPVEDLARGAVEWLLAQADTTEHGLVWRPVAGETQIDPTLYHGGAGIVLALLEAYQHLGQDRYGEAAARGARASAEEVERASSPLLGLSHKRSAVGRLPGHRSSRNGGTRRRIGRSPELGSARRKQDAPGTSRATGSGAGLPDWRLEPTSIHDPSALSRPDRVVLVAPMSALGSHEEVQPVRLIDAQITNYRSIEDSEKFDIDPEVTCLVGKNEAGKTGLLQALYRLNPVENVSPFDEHLDFPAKRTRQRRQYAEEELTSLFR